MIKIWHSLEKSKVKLDTPFTSNINEQVRRIDEYDVFSLNYDHSLINKENIFI